MYFGVVVCAFLFFKAANASCLNATQEVHSSGMCYPALTSLGNTSVCNMSSQCGLLFDDVLTFCNSTVSQDKYDCLSRNQPSSHFQIATSMFYNFCWKSLATELKYVVLAEGTSVYHCCKFEICITFHTGH